MAIESGRNFNNSIRNPEGDCQRTSPTTLRTGQDGSAAQHGGEEGRGTDGGRGQGPQALFLVFLDVEGEQLGKYAIMLFAAATVFVPPPRPFCILFVLLSLSAALRCSGPRALTVIHLCVCNPNIKTKYEDAIDLYGKAANFFKMAKCWQNAGEAFVKCAECEMKLKSHHEPSSLQASIPGGWAVSRRRRSQSGHPPSGGRDRIANVGGRSIIHH